MKNFIQWGVFVMLLFSIQACMAQDTNPENYEYWIIRVGDDLECAGIRADYNEDSETFTVKVVGEIGVSNGELGRTFYLNDIRHAVTDCAIIVVKGENETQRQAENAMLLAIESGGIIEKVVEHRMASR